MEPNSLNQPTQPVASSPPTAQLQAIVDYMPNVTIVGSKTVLLEWTADNRIRMYEMNFDTMQATAVVFDASIADIKKVTGSVNMLTFHVGEKTYRTLFARMMTSGMGAVGAGIAIREANTSGANLWVTKLKENGIKVSTMGWGATFAIAIGIVVVITTIVIVVMAAGGSF